MKKIFISALAVAMCSLSAVAQNGLLFNNTSSDIMQATDMLDASRENSGYMTARAAAMGGAFSSLGADLSSMALNPAGLGMYRSSEVGFTMSVSDNRTSSMMNLAETGKTRFAFNNFGVAMKLFEDDDSSVVIGIAYNRQDDYNYKSRYSLGSLSSSIADVFAYQMTGVNAADLDTSADPYNNTAIGLDQWGGIMAYNTYLINNESYTDFYYSALETDAVADSYMDIIHKGSKGEYDFSLGVNLEDFIYFGATLGIQDIYHKRDYFYTEDFSGQSSEPYVQYMGYNPYSIESGLGVNLKVGAVVRPAGGLRIGVALHTPTYYSMDKSYVASMWSKYTHEINEYYATSLVYDYMYEYNTPAKMLLGISYTFDQYAILSLDYDRVWYQGIRTSDSSREYRNYIKATAKDNFYGANNVRVGLELKPAPYFSLRGGYSYYGSPYKKELQDAGYYFNSPIATETNSYSAGFGFRFGGASLDFAAVFSTTNYTDYDVYYYKVSDTEEIASPIVRDNKLKRGIYSMSLSIPF